MFNNCNHCENQEIYLWSAYSPTEIKKPLESEVYRDLKKLFWIICKLWKHQTYTPAKVNNTSNMTIFW